MAGLMRVFSGSCMDLDDQELAVMPVRRVERKHVLGSGADFFDESTGRPLQPQPKTMNKVFSGSTLDLNACDDESPSPSASGAHTPPQPTYVTLSNYRLPGTNEHINRLPKSRISVAVIGGGSYTSPHVVAAAITAGFTVRCALVVAAATDTTLTDDILRSVPPEARSRLQVIPVDLYSSSSLQEAIRGCPYIIHCGLQSVPPGRDIVESHSRAVAALFDAISAIGSDRFTRVVLTGSASSVYHPVQTLPKGKTAFDETTQNVTASRTTDPQQFAKLKFEEEAWRLQKISRVELCTILPSVIIGPSLTSEMSEAMRTLGEMARSQSSVPFVPRMYWNFVDVRDVARAHVLALEVPAAANQRFIVTCQNVSMAEIGLLIRHEYPHLKPPIYNAPFIVSLLLGPLYNARVSFMQAWRSLGRRPVLNGDKARKRLGLELTPLNETVRDSIQDLMERGFVPTASAIAAPTGGEESRGASPAAAASTDAVAALGGRRGESSPFCLSMASWGASVAVLGAFVAMGIFQIRHKKRGL